MALQRGQLLRQKFGSVGNGLATGGHKPTAGGIETLLAGLTCGDDNAMRFLAESPDPGPELLRTNGQRQIGLLLKQGPKISGAELLLGRQCKGWMLLQQLQPVGCWDGQQRALRSGGKKFQRLPRLQRGPAGDEARGVQRQGERTLRLTGVIHQLTQLTVLEQKQGGRQGIGMKEGFPHGLLLDAEFGGDQRQLLRQKCGKSGQTCELLRGGARRISQGQRRI